MNGKGRAILLLWFACLSLAGVTACSEIPNMGEPQGEYIALVGGTLIDGSRADPVPNAVVLIQGERIAAVGPVGQVPIPEDAKQIDVSGMTVLPGFINTHVHYGFSEENLRAWVAGGVTTVRDEGLFSGQDLSELLAWRSRIRDDPQYARLVSTGQMISVPGGYGSLFISGPEEGRQAVLRELALGFDQIKVSLEDGYAGESCLPKLSADELTAIVKTAHQAGRKVSGHITEAAYLNSMLDAGVDDIAHCAWDRIPVETLQRMAAQDIILIPTFTVFRNYGAPLDSCVTNLAAFRELGGRIALGNDYGGGPGEFELGIPMFEIEMMASAGLSPLEIIQSATSIAAATLDLENEIGILSTGRIADILVVTGNPLVDLQALRNIQLVIHNGTILIQK